MMRFGSGLAIAVILLGVSPKSSAADAVLALFDDPGASADEIFRYDLTDDTFTEISSSFNWNTVRDITLDSDGNILALFDDPGASADEVFRYHLTDNTFIEVSSSFNWNTVRAIVSDGAGGIYGLFDDPGASADEIFRYDLTDNTFTEISSSFNWNTVRDITLDTDGNILALFDDPGASADEVFRFDVSANTFTEISSSFNFNTTWAINTDSQTTLLGHFDDPGATAHEIFRHDLTTGTFTEISSSGNWNTVRATVFQPDIIVVQTNAQQVTNTNDSGPGSLRDAIDFANSNAGVDVVSFDIPGAGPHTIQLVSPLAPVDDPTVIDGTSQPGYSGAPLIEIDGTNAGTNATGLTITAGSSTVKGLAINRFDAMGISLFTSGGNTIESNYIGIDPTGTFAAGNGQTGLNINAPNNTIGGTDPAERNVISGNQTGLRVSGGSATGNTIQGNYIGTNAAGDAAVGNFDGVSISTPGSVLGGTGPGEGNVVSGNTHYGLSIGSSVTIQGNLIGTNASGTAPLGNSLAGIKIHLGENNTIGGEAPGARNIVSGNGIGVDIGGASATGNLVAGNYIGTDINGTVAVGNFDGIKISNGANNTIGGTTTAARNIISGNGDDGIQISSGASNNQVTGNYIGINAAGTGGLGNAGSGVYLLDVSGNTVGGPAAGAGNVLSGSGQGGVSIQGINASNNVVQGNLIGTDATATAPIANNYGISIYDGSGNTIGGTATGAGNTISGNTTLGISILHASGTGPVNNAIQGNHIYDNGGLGIDLATDGLTANDPGDGDTGPNNLQNFPVLTQAVAGASTVSGTLNSTASTSFALEFFTNSACDAGGNGEGQTLLGITNVTTNGSGDISFTASVAPAVVLGEFITATATDPNGNTSEFAQCLEVISDPLLVTNTNDSGPGSLRAVLAYANGNAGLDLVRFAIPGAGPHSIQPTSELADITDPVIIDGTTQPGYSGTPIVELDGSGLSGTPIGLDIHAGGSTVRGLMVNGYSLHAGVYFKTIGGNTVEDCYLGVDATGTIARGNGAGAIVTSSNNSIINNVISGNGFSGIVIQGVTASNNVVQGNLIGTDASGSAVVSNTIQGIMLDAGTSNNTIGGTTPAERNLISGNLQFGVRLRNLNGDPTGNMIQGNYIGTDITGTIALPNGTQSNIGNAGVFIDGASSNSIGGIAPGAGNLISGNDKIGILIHPSIQLVPAHDNLVQGNLIGTDPTGTIALPNNRGVVIRLSTSNTIGGTDPAARNIISGNNSHSVVIDGAAAANNLVLGNYLGTDFTGTVALGNTGNGVRISAAGNNTIGGTLPGARNIISGNGGEIVIGGFSNADGNIVQGNFVGTDVTGTIALGNSLSDGISITGGDDNLIGGIVAGAGNVVGGMATGVVITSSTNHCVGNLVQGNFIGTDLTGTIPLGNAADGVVINDTPSIPLYSTSNTIGGTAPGAGNTIAFNAANGVRLNGGTDNAILGNRIFSNVSLGIDMSNDGVTANDPGDADTGPNRLQNYPVISGAGANDNLIRGDLNSAASTSFTLEFFANSVCDASGNGEGQTPLGSAIVATDAGGDATFSASITGFAIGEFVTATATDPSGNTSEFASCISAVANLNQPPIANAGPDQPTAVCGIDVLLIGSDSSDPDGDDLTYAWSEGGQPLATGETPTVTLATGVHTIDLVVNDGTVSSAPDQVIVTVADTTPPDVTLLGNDPILIELGASYVDPGATALDLCDGDLTGQIAVTNPVDVNTEGQYNVTYDVADAAGNPASATRSVEVVSTPNSYVLTAIHSMYIKKDATIHSGFVGVVDYSLPPYQSGGIELVFGVSAVAESGVQISSPRVKTQKNAIINGTLVYDVHDEGKNVTVNQEVTPGSWPLFGGIGLPAFRSSTPGLVDIDVAKNQSLTLAPTDGPFNEVKVRQNGILTLTGGTYHMNELDLGKGAAVLIQAPTTLLIAEKFALDQNGYFGPETTAVDPNQIFIYVEGVNGGNGNLGATPNAARIGKGATFSGNLYAPNGTIHMRQNSQSTGSFIGNRLILGVSADVHLRSGWATPGVVFDPPPPPPAAKVAYMRTGDNDGLHAGNHPNPFNPATTIRYSLPEFGHVKLSVYNALGQEVKVLVNRPQAMGLYRVEWDGRDASGRHASSGLYFYRLQSGEQAQTGRMLLIK